MSIHSIIAVRIAIVAAQVAWIIQATQAVPQ